MVHDLQHTVTQAHVWVRFLRTVLIADGILLYFSSIARLLAYFWNRFVGAMPEK